MDGNRRWAKARGLPTLQGHALGYEKIKDVMEWADEAGVEHIVIYAFSTENWKRTEEEVNYLMNLFRKMLIAEEIKEMKRRELRVRFIGERGKFAPDIGEGMERMESETKDGKKNLWVALSYGGRPEILVAVKNILREKNKDEVEKLTEEDFSKFLWTAEMPDPDIIIRTGGEQRLSNFLPWQSVYSELFFTETFWPDFSKEEFEKILEEYAGRERRRGK